MNFSESSYAPSTTTPAYGEHTQQLLLDFGWSDDEVKALVEEGVVGTTETSPFK